MDKYYDAMFHQRTCREAAYHELSSVSTDYHVINMVSTLGYCNLLKYAVMKSKGNVSWDRLLIFTKTNNHERLTRLIKNSDRVKGNGRTEIVKFMCIEIGTLFAGYLLSKLVEEKYSQVKPSKDKEPND
jgi:hypothetical protein